MKQQKRPKALTVKKRVETRHNLHLKKQISSRLVPTTHRELVKLARADNRTISVYVEMVVEQHVRSRRGTGAPFELVEPARVDFPHPEPEEVKKTG